MRYLSTRRYAFAALAILVALIMSFTPSARAQSQAGSGQVVGTTYDSSGSTVPDAKVALASKALGINRETTTNQEGQYLFVLVPIGHYNITFTKTGFKTYKVDVEVTVGAAVAVNATLALGEVSQVVEVSATPLIESTEIRPDATIGVRKIEELPINGRRFQDFVTLTPTVQIEPQRNGISFAGQRGINGYVAIDGADYTEPFFGGIRGGERSNNAFTIPQEAISQFQVVSYGFSVEFGRSTGGIVNATTKSGSNDWHGSAFMYARNGKLAGLDAFQRQAITNLYQGGASFGGPVKHDKLFFFSAFEIQKNENPRLVIFHTLDGFNPLPQQTEAFNFYQAQEGGSQAGLPFAQTNDALTGLGRLDYQVNANHRVTLRYHYSKNTGENAVSTGDAISPETTRAQSNNGIEGDRTNTATGQWTAIFSPTVVMETRAQYSLENRPRLSNSAVANIQGPIATTGSRDFLPTTLDDWRLQVSPNLTWTHGTHTLKFGGEYNHVNVDQSFFFNQFGTFSLTIPNTVPSPSCSPGTSTGNCRTVNTLNLLSCNVATVPTCTSGAATTSDDPVHRFDTNGAPSGTTVAYKVNVGNGQLQATMKQIAVFIQDQWRVNSRLTVTAGFRWEGYVNPEPGSNNTSLVNQIKNFAFPLGITGDPGVLPNNYRQYMPRVGLAWDLNGRGTTVVRANAGFFYAPTPLIIYAAPLNNFRLPAGDISVQLPLALPSGFVCTPLFAGDNCKSAYDQMRRIGIDLDTFTLDKPPTLTPDNITQIATALGLSSPNPFSGAAPIFAANNYESPRSWQWNLGIEHEITRGWSAGLDFVYVNTVHLERNRNLNLPAPIIFQGTTITLSGQTAVFPADLSQRPCFGVVSGSVCTPSKTVGGVFIAVPTRARPVPTLGDVTIRASDARSRYNGMTLRTNYRRGRVQFQSYYTLSWNYSDDDNERLAGGFDHDNEFNLAPEYFLSRLDTRHLWVINGLIDLPGGVTLASLGKFRSAHPIEVLAGSDLNGDNTSFPDRAFASSGVPFLRNSFRDQRQYNVDLRAAWHANVLLQRMGVHFREGMRLDITADFFNIFNFDNIQFIGGTPTPFTSTDVYGAGVSSATGAVLPANSGYRLLKDAGFCSNNRGCYNPVTTPGPPIQVQLGVRFQF